MAQNSEYTDKLTRIMEKAQQLDSMLSEVTRDLLEAKDNSPPDSGRYINSAISSLGVMHRSLSTVKYELNNAARPPKPKGSQQFQRRNESAAQKGPTELDMMVQALVERGYNRNSKAIPNQIWYAHPAGHQIAAAQNGKTFQWTYFPPRMEGAIEKGIGLQKLNTQLEQAHRHDPQPAPQNEEEERVRDYLIQQMEESPIEQYRVWERGEEYPSIVTFVPKSGTWRCFTCSGNNIESSHDPDIHTEAVKRWVRNGKPAPIDQTISGGGYERPGFQSTNSPIGLMDLNPTRKTP